MRKTYKFRLYPTKDQEERLDYWLYLCRRLYNTLLEQRQIAYKMGRNLNGVAQNREITILRRELPEYMQVGSHVLQDVVKRLDKSFQSYFAGCKRGEKEKGYPKFQGRDRYDSFTFPDHGNWKLVDGRLEIRNIGSIEVKWSREIEGDIKTVTIKRRAGQWHVCFSCDNVPAPVYPETDAATGIDLGIEHLATRSDGKPYENAQFLKRKLKHLRRLERHKSRQKKGSNRRKKTVRLIQKLHLKIANQRADAHHKASTELVREYAEIHKERIGPQFMLKNKRLARAASDVGWGQFTRLLQSKAAAAGRKIVEKDPHNTSQECSGCGELVHKKLNERWHKCSFCGTSLHRDHNAAIVILNRPAL